MRAGCCTLRWVMSLPIRCDCGCGRFARDYFVASPSSDRCVFHVAHAREDQGERLGLLSCARQLCYPCRRVMSHACVLNATGRRAVPGRVCEHMRASNRGHEIQAR
eukprot:6909207-Alexandrium_andersonii.AAC.1